jgi:hypothetical protein
MVLRNPNLPSGRLKNDYDGVDEAKFQGVVVPCELIFWIPGFEKGDFNEEANVNY